jgi:glycosyltransferase involved in cell wall biosynthesis
MVHHNRLNIAIVGSRGIPGNYGGFETFAERLSLGLVERGHKVTVYCTAAYDKYRHQDYKGVKRVLIPSIPIKSVEKVFTSLLSCIHAASACYQIIYFLGVSPVLYAWLPRLMGAKTVINIDGLEWKRQKWGKIAAWYLKFSESLSGTVCNAVIADSMEIKKYFRKEYGKEAIYIAYGADVASFRDTGVLAKYGLESRKYFLQVCRLEPENNTEILLREYAKVDTDIPLVILGGAPYSDKYQDNLRGIADKRVKFLGSVYGDDYNVIRSHAYFYIHGHEVGGTNPALLEALAAGNCVVVLDVKYNLEVIGDSGLSFSKNDSSLSAVLTHLIAHPEHAEDLRMKAKERIRQCYTWESIIDQYEDFFSKLV